jgi:hypothetical protein
MNAEIQDGLEASSRGAGWGWVFCLGAILLLYVLSTGPVVLMLNKRPPAASSPVWQVIVIVYAPVDWAYRKTTLQRPIEMYLRLWVPKVYKRKGNSK